MGTENIEIKPSEIVCDKCNGVGNLTKIIEYEIRGMIHRVPGIIEYELCPKCNGSGKLDWIEQIVGKHRNPYEEMSIPLMRKKYPKLITKELVNVQPIFKKEK